MQFQYSHRRDEKEAIFFSVENGQTTTIAKGSLCSWDTTNPTINGVVVNVAGTRVIVYPVAPTAGTHLKAGFATTDMEGTPASTRGTQSYLVQVYGWRNDVLVRSTAADNDTIVGGFLIPSTEASGAGKVMGVSTVAAPTATEVVNKVGIALAIVAVGPTSATIEAIVNTLS